MRRSTTVWLYPLGPEHTLPMLFDVLFSTLIYVTWRAALGFSDGFLGSVAILATVLGFHALQMAFVFVRFDDTAITLVRPWRGRRRIEWSQVAGLIYTQGFDTDARARTPYRLRVVLKDNAPPLGRFLTGRELEPYAKGPVVMALSRLESELHVGSDRRSVRCEKRVYALLTEHGFPTPEPRALAFRSPLYTPDELRRADVADLKRWRPVTVTHGQLIDDDAVRLVGTVLPELARECGPGPTGSHDHGRYSTFLFDEQGPADAFFTAARGVTPLHWRISRSALPDLSGPH